MTNEIETETEAMTIFQLMPLIAREIGVVGKGGVNEQQGFAFRGIDQMMAAASPALIKHGVFTVPEVLQSETSVVQTTTGKNTNLVELTVAYTFYGPTGDSVRAVTYGEAMDSGDKAANKAMSAAYKYALVQTFCVPTMDMIEDADATSPDGSYARASGGKQSQSSYKKNTSTFKPRPQRFEYDKANDTGEAPTAKQKSAYVSMGKEYVQNGGDIEAFKKAANLDGIKPSEYTKEMASVFIARATNELPALRSSKSASAAPEVDLVGFDPSNAEDMSIAAGLVDAAQADAAGDPF